jgi:hypothetical protein
MTFDSKNSLNGILHPFLFVLEEGREIKENPFAYSLRLMHLHTKEHIKSPGKDVYPLLPSMQPLSHSAISRN